VYCRVARGEFVFDDTLEATEFVEAVRTVRDLDDWRILAWVLMGNHYHFVVNTGSIPLWRSMLRLQSNVARSYNKRHGYLGRLWQSRYRARIIDTQEYLRQAVAYVHLNPVAAGLVKDPAEHRNCGHGEILGLEPLRLVDLEELTRGFNDGFASDALRLYLSWIRDVAEARWVDQGFRELPWWKEARDLDEIADPERHPESRTFDDRSLDDDRVPLSIDEFGSFFEIHSGWELDDLSSMLKRPRLVRARIEYTILAVTRYGLRSTEAARLIRKHPTSVSRWIERGLADLRSSPSFRRRIDDLDRRISRSARTNPSRLRLR
jgi:REP element-mobilizing transposase RayT